MSTPADCRVSDTHEWFRVNGTTVTMGITQHAADELTDITYVEMKPAGTSVSAGGSVGEVESVKTTSEIYAAAAGKRAEEIVRRREAQRREDGARPDVELARDGRDVRRVRRARDVEE
jgi:hypothetical protein